MQFTITFRYDGDHETKAEAIEAARERISHDDFEPSLANAVADFIPGSELYTREDVMDSLIDSDVTEDTDELYDLVCRFIEAEEENYGILDEVNDEFGSSRAHEFIIGPAIDSAREAFKAGQTFEEYNAAQAAVMAAVTAKWARRA